MGEFTVHGPVGAARLKPAGAACTHGLCPVPGGAGLSHQLPAPKGNPTQGAALLTQKLAGHPENDFQENGLVDKIFLHAFFVQAGGVLKPVSNLGFTRPVPFLEPSITETQRMGWGRMIDGAGSPQLPLVLGRSEWPDPDYLLTYCEHTGSRARDRCCHLVSCWVRSLCWDLWGRSGQPGTGPRSLNACLFEDTHFFTASA